MAEAYGKLTGEPGVLFVTRGPGATNGAIGVHTGLQDSTPMVIFIGQVPNEFAEREAFQEIDYRRMYGQMAKWVGQIDRVERIPEYVSHAFTPQSRRPGPVVLALPEDTLFAQAAVADVPKYNVVRPAPSSSDLEKLRDLLKIAQPRFLLIGGGWSRDACVRLQKWIEANGLPVGTSFRCQDLFDNRSPNYAGDVGIGINPKLAQRIKEADVLLVIGARLGEMTTSAYSLVEVPVPQQTLVHVHAGGRARARVPAGARDQLGDGAVRGCVEAFFRSPSWKEGLRPPARIHGMDRAAADARRDAVWRGDPLALRAACRRTRSSPAARATSWLAAPAFPLQGIPHSARLHQRFDGLRLSGSGGSQARTAAAPCSRSAATAISS